MKLRFINPKNYYSYWQVGFIMFSLFFCFYQSKVYYENSVLQENGSIINVKILNKECVNTGSRAQYIDVIYSWKRYNRIEIPSRKYCLSLRDSIPLIYNKKNDEFYVPNTLFMNRRFMIASILLLIISLLPLKKISNVLKKYY